jgi:transposase
MEACVGAHHLNRKLKALGHDARLMPAKYVRSYSKNQKNDFRDAEAFASDFDDYDGFDSFKWIRKKHDFEAVQRPTMKFVATKTAYQLDLQPQHRVRERLVSQRTGIINQIRAFLLDRCPRTVRLALDCRHDIRETRQLRATSRHHRSVWALG